MSPKSEWVQVENLRELQSAIRRLQDRELGKQLRKTNLAGAEIVAAEARRLAPVKTGKLRRSIKAKASQRDARVQIGTPARVPYAGPVVGGAGPPRPQGGYNRRNNFPGRALKAKVGALEKEYKADIERLARRVLEG